jgi:hypothetical protein
MTNNTETNTDLATPSDITTALHDLRHDALKLQDLLGQLASFASDPFVRDRLGSEGKENLEPLILECVGRASFISVHVDYLGRLDAEREQGGVA